jgi:DNA-binding response OmpR family regulator
MAMPKNQLTPWTFVLDEPLRILIVDDDPILREFASVHLSTPFTTIDTACDGVEARAMLAQGPYDVVLLDIEMPQLDGFSLLAEIRSNGSMRGMRVIMLTGRDDIVSIDRAYQLGADSFATKPVNWRQLSYQIRYVVRTSGVEPSQSNSSDLHAELHLQPTPVSTDRGSADLQSVIEMLEALDRELLASERAQRTPHPATVRSSIARALADCRAIESGASERTDGLGDTASSQPASHTWVPNAGLLA